jgi:hypothetical protein
MLYLQNYWIMASIQHAGVKQLVLYWEKKENQTILHPKHIESSCYWIV